MHTERSTVVGVFHDRSQAERAIDALKRVGFSDDQIGLAVRDATGRIDGGVAEAEDAGDRTAAGAVTGAGIGAVLGALATGIIPGVGPIIAGGLLAGVLGGAAAGAVAGGLVGGLTGLGVPEEEAQYYNREFEAGRTIVTVRAPGRYDEAWQILNQNGAYDGETRDTARAPMADQTADATEAQRMKLRAEEMTPRKDAVQTGQEEVVIEHHPVERMPADQPIRESQTVRIPVKEEHVTVEKQPVVTGEVSVGKRRVQESQPVSGDVRHEELRVNQEGNAPIRGWDQASRTYRSRFEQRSGGMASTWEDAEPAYRYGYERRSDPRYQGRAWGDVEPELRTDWESRHGDKPWDRAADSVRDAWEDRT